MPARSGQFIPASYGYDSWFSNRLNCNELNTNYEQPYSGYPTLWAKRTRWLGFRLNSLTVFSLSQL
jgi:hypothetical protein